MKITEQNRIENKKIIRQTGDFDIWEIYDHKKTVFYYIEHCWVVGSFKESMKGVKESLGKLSYKR